MAVCSWQSDEISGQLAVGCLLTSSDVTPFLFQNSGGLPYAWLGSPLLRQLVFGSRQFGDVTWQLAVGGWVMSVSRWQLALG